MLQFTQREEQSFRRYAELSCPFPTYYDYAGWGIAQLRIAVYRERTFDLRLILAKALKLNTEETANLFVPILPNLEGHSFFRDLWDTAYQTYGSKRYTLSSNVNFLALIHIGAVVHGVSFAVCVPLDVLRSVNNALRAMAAEDGRKVHCSQCYVMKSMNKPCLICGFIPNKKEKEKPQQPSAWATNTTTTTTNTYFSTSEILDRFHEENE